MKNFVLVAAICLATSLLMAQDNDPKNAIKLNPLSLVFATGNVAYERAVSANQTFQLGVFYTGASISGLKYTGLGITPEYRFYVAGNKTALNGVYVGPFVRYQSFKIEEKSSGHRADFTSFGGGAVVGWEKTWASGFVLDVFAGPAYNAGKLKNNSNDFDVSGSIDGFGIRTGITLGFAF